METTTIKQTYEGIEITYDEGANLWRFELRGRERSAESLAKAKDIIDTPVKSKQNTFSRFKAYRLTTPLGGKFTVEIVTVTSLAESRFGQQAWISHADGYPGPARERVNAESLIPVTEYNTALVMEIKKLEEERENLKARVRELSKKLNRYEVKPE